MKELEKIYHKREKTIDVIMTYGTGFETREALRMVPTPVLDKWATETLDPKKKVSRKYSYANIKHFVLANWAKRRDT